ncbi:MAG: TPM domain-containing protein [Bacteroidetes bacterium]|nr:TPM domain-containing protein [Bacteroidota bacterium]
MKKAANFFSGEEKEQIVQAIKAAEVETSGEIRLHIEEKTEIPALERAIEIFRFLEMDKTAARNGVLIYLSIENKSFAIFGDAGINDKVPTDFWDITKEIMVGQFSQKAYLQGLLDGINSIGVQLKTHFPFDENIDKNELPDDISFG